MAVSQEQAINELVKRGRLTRQEGAQRILELRRPAEQLQQPEPRRESVVPAPVAEFASSVNRGITEGVDFVTEGVNAGIDLVGLDARIPSLTRAAQERGIGVEGFMEPGTARDVVQTAGEFAPGVAGVAGAAKGIPSLFSRESPVRSKITELAQSGNRQAQDLVERVRIRQSGDVDTAKKTISESGQIVRDKLAQNAIKQGFDEGVVAAVKATNPETRQRMRKMVDILERGKQNSRFAVENRPTDVVGDAVANRVKVVKAANKRAGKAIDKASQGLEGQKINASEATQGFFDDLQSLGVSIDEDLKPVFEGSDIEDIPGAERVIKTVLRRVNRLRETGDAMEAHRLKRFIDDQVTFGKTEGLSGRAERALKGLRRSVDNQLDQTFDAYKKANDAYSETIQALDQFQDVAGRKIDIFGENADKSIGTLSRRLMSNVQSRVNMLEAIQELDRVAGRLGRAPDDDVLMLALFADELDSVFKPVARTSLGGEFAKTAATEGQSGIIRKAAEQGVDLARGVNEENALRDIKRLLAR